MWLKARRKLLAQVKSQVALRLGSSSLDLIDYSADFKKEFRGRWVKTDLKVLERAIVNSDVVLGADFHAFAQSQKTHLRILRRLPSQERVVLALECFEAKHQKWLDEYLVGDMSERTFLQKIEWETRWGFPWENYRPLLLWAMDTKVPVFGINTFGVEKNSDSLKAREHFAAQRIAKLKAEHPGAMIYTLFGDYHLAGERLPKLLRELGVGRLLTVFQNSEELYFRKVQKRLEGPVEVLRKDARFCILNSPPWVQWQSYLIYLEQMYDRDLDESIDYTEHVGTLTEFIAKDLNLKIRVDDLSVFSAEDRNLWAQLGRNLSKLEKKTLAFLIENDHSFYLPKAQSAYLSRQTINHAAMLSGKYLHAKLCGLKTNFFTPPQQFLAMIWCEAVGFFLSKLINHHRKADSMESIKTQLAVSLKKDRGREALKLALNQRMSEIAWLHGRKPPKSYRPKRVESYIEASRILGTMLGDALYYGYQTRRIRQTQLLQWLKHDVSNSEFESFYLQVTRKLSPFFARHGRA